MREAMAALVHWQQHVDATGLPAYDDALLRRELALFPEWCVQKEFGITWTEAQQAQWSRVCDHLVASALAQPTVVAPWAALMDVSPAKPKPIIMTSATMTSRAIAGPLLSSPSSSGNLLTINGVVISQSI